MRLILIEFGLLAISITNKKIGWESKCMNLVKEYNFLKIIFISIIIVQSIIIVSIPLIHFMNDSGWYFMNVHFVNTGEYITESRYPSFNSPSQYYPFFGYSFFLYLCNELAVILDLGVSDLIKYFQFVMYVLSAILVKRIVNEISKKEKLAYVNGITFLLYYPYFNYVSNQVAYLLHIECWISDDGFKLFELKAQVPTNGRIRTKSLNSTCIIDDENAGYYYWIDWLDKN